MLKIETKKKMKQKRKKMKHTYGARAGSGVAGDAAASLLPDGWGRRGGGRG